MKCERIWGFYSWRHLVHDSQMGWLKLVSSLSFFFFRPGKAVTMAQLHLWQIIARGVHPLGELERCRAKNERATRGKGRKGGGEERKREREPCRNKLAVSCRGMEGETKMDTLMLSKCRRWVEAYGSPRPFHSTTVDRYTSLPVLFLKGCTWPWLHPIVAHNVENRKSQFARRPCKPRVLLHPLSCTCASSVSTPSPGKSKLLQRKIAEGTI